MAKKRCVYVLLALCIVGVLLGIAVVLVLIKLLIVPLRGNLRPMTTNCLIVDISPAVTTTLAPVQHPATGYRAKIGKRPNLENDILPKDDPGSFGQERRTAGKKDCRRLGFNLTCLTGSQHRTRHAKAKIRHGYRDEGPDTINQIPNKNDTCYIVSHIFIKVFE